MIGLTNFYEFNMSLKSHTILEKYRFTEMNAGITDMKHVPPKWMTDSVIKLVLDIIFEWLL